MVIVYRGQAMRAAGKEVFFSHPWRMECLPTCALSFELDCLPFSTWLFPNGRFPLEVKRDLDCNKDIITQ